MLNSMKKFALLVLFALPLAFTSCKKDFKLLDGTWEITSWTYNGIDLIHSNLFSEATIIFTSDDKDDGTFTWTFTVEEDIERIAGKYTMDAKANTITLTMDDTPQTFSYKVDKDNLELTGTVDGITMTIKGIQ